jgi:hypothetical protein
MTQVLIAAIIVAFSTVSLRAEEGGSKAGATENKNITIIAAESKADGKSEVRKELVEECIVSLPKPQGLVATTKAHTKYLKDIDGKEGDDRYVKTYTASVEINYLVRQKELIIITTSSVTGQEPVIKEVERMVRKSETIVSDPEEGDLFAGSSPRRYYFSDPGKAEQDARDRAAAWLKQHADVVCP